MANLTLPAQADATFSADVYRIETADPVLGHDGSQINIANLQARRLAENDLFLKERTDNLANGTALSNNSIQRTKLARGVLPINVPRNTVISGPYSNGQRQILTASGTTLSFAAGVRLAFAAGYDDKGPIDYFGNISAGGNVLDVPNNSTTYHIYARLNAGNGAVEVRGSAIAPVYSHTAPSSPANLTFWYDQNEEKMKRWNSGASEWQEILAVFVGLARKLANGSWDTITTFEYRRDVNLESAVPAGTIVPYAGAFPPTGWLLCDGAEIGISAYPRLYSAIGTAFGGDANAGYFQTPDLRGRVPVGKDNMGDNAANRVTSAGSSINGVALGAAGGAQNVILDITQIPPHSHVLTSRNDRNTVTGGNDEIASFDEANDTYNTGVTGGAGGVTQAHNNMQPSLITNYIIKA